MYLFVCHIWMFNVLEPEEEYKVSKWAWYICLIYTILLINK